MLYDIRLAANGKAKVEYFGRMGGNLATPNEVETALVKKFIEV
jgi:2-oxoglutarate ferredoxin oxidoreductase subunit alpha